MPTVAVVGTFDTKGEEHTFLAEQIRKAGVDTMLIDVGILGPKPATIDVSREEVAAAGGESLEAAEEGRGPLAGHSRIRYVNTPFALASRTTCGPKSAWTRCTCAASRLARCRHRPSAFWPTSLRT